MHDVGQRLGLEGRAALVTGATRGLGLAIAHKLCASGCEVYVNYAHSDEDAEQAARALARYPGTATLVKADIGQPEMLREMLGMVRERHGGLDIFVHNAASYHPMSTAAVAVNEFRIDLSTALEPLLHGAPILADLMPTGSGRIIAVSSSGARRVVPQYVSLGVAKAALESLVRYLAVEFAGRQIAVNAVATSKLDKGAATTDPATTARLAARTPAERLTTPGDVADVVALLCTDEAAWIRGQVITVDGGLVLSP